LGSAKTFGVLAHDSITNTGATKISGNLGVYSGSVVTGITADMVSGDQFTNSVAEDAQKDLTSAIAEATSRTADFAITGDQNGITLVPGTYSADVLSVTTGVFKLDAQNSATSAWIFNIVSTLTLAAGASIELINSPLVNNSDPHIFWNVGSSATLGSGSVLVGACMAHSSISVANGAKTGPLLANTGAVTLINNQITAYHTDASSNDDISGDDGDDEVLSTGAIIGIAIGGFIFLLLLILLLWYCCCRGKHSETQVHVKVTKVEVQHKQEHHKTGATAGHK
jgi:hypothetical protein